MARTVLVLGGARAGKSRYALGRLRELAAGAPVAVVATAEPLDEEMAARIARHRAERPPEWLTVEAPLALVPALTGLAGRAAAVLVDCLNLWVANLLGQSPGPGDQAVAEHAAELARLVRAVPFHLVMVSNEVGSGVHPETALGRRFRDALGMVNQVVAAAAGEVVLVVAGCPLVVKGPP